MEKALFIEYPKCSTCRNAKKFLEAKGIDFIDRHIVEDTPTAEELRQIIAKSGLNMKKFFNTSGLVYKELQLKDRLPGMTEDEKLALLASNGMLIKRPILVLPDTVLVGFKEAQWEEALKG